MAGRDSVDVAIRLHGQRKFAKEVEASAAELETLGVKGAKSVASFAKTSEKLKSFGRSWTRNISLPMAGLGVVAGKMAIDFHQAMSLVQTQAGASAKETRFLESAVLKMGENSKFGPTELADALFRVRSAGFKAKEALDVLEQGKNLSTVGNSDLEMTTKALTGAAKSLKLEKAGQLRGLAAEMNSIVGTGDMRMEELQDALSTGVLPAFVSAGLGIRDYGSALTVMTDRNVPAQVASTRLRTAVTMLVPHTKKAEEALEGVGIQSETLATIMRKKGLPTAIQYLAEKLSVLTPNKQNRVMIEAFGGAKSSATIETLVENSQELFKKWDLIGQGVGKYNKEIGVAERQPGTELEKAWSAIQVSLIHIGDELLPAIVPGVKKVAGVFTDVAHAFTGLPTNVQATAAAFLILTGPVASGLGFFAGGVGRTLIMVAKLNREVSGFSSIFGTAMSAGQGPLRSFGMAFEGTGVQGALSTAKGFALSLGPAVAAYGIGNIVTSALSGDWQDAGYEAGGAMAGGIAGFLIGDGPLGAMLGVGIGSLGGELLSGLFSPTKKVTFMQEQLKSSAKGVKSALDQEKGAMSSLSVAAKRAAGAHRHVTSASEALKHAEHALERVRQSEPGHAVAIARDEIRVANAVRGVTAAKRAERKAERVKGVDRSIAKESLRYLTLELRHRKNVLGARKGELLEQRHQAQMQGKSLQELEPVNRALSKVTGQLDQANKQLSGTLQKASTQVGPKFASFLRNSTRSVLEFGSQMKAADATATQVLGTLQRFNNMPTLELGAPPVMPTIPHLDGPAAPTGKPSKGGRGRKPQKVAQSLEMPPTRRRREASGDLGDRLEELLEIHVHSYLELDGKTTAESVARHSARARGPRMTPHPKIRLAAIHKPIDIEVQPGDGAATPTAGHSGWEVVQRNKKKGMTKFAGVEPLQQDVPIFVDGLADGRSVERIWEQIMELGGGTIFRAYGPVELPGHRHVFGADPEISEQVKDAEGRRIRFKLVLKLMEYVPADQAGKHHKSRVPRHQRGEPAKTGGTAFPGRSYTTTQGQTLIDVARLLYANWEMARAIGQKNGIADVHKKLPAGTKLKLPKP